MTASKPGNATCLRLSLSADQYKGLNHYDSCITKNQLGAEIWKHGFHANARELASIISALNKLAPGLVKS